MKKIFGIVFIVFALFISLLYFIELIYDDISALKANKILSVDNSKSQKHKKPLLQDYVIINKNCINCINERKGNAGCVVAKNGEILLVRYKRTNKINLPGGFRDYVHKDTVIASEEMRNAVGYVVSIEDFLKDFHPIVGYSRDINFRLYKCQIIKKINKTNDKILEEVWVDKQKLYDLIKGKNREVDFSDELNFIYDKFEFLVR